MSKRSRLWLKITYRSVFQIKGRIIEKFAQMVFGFGSNPLPSELGKNGPFIGEYKQNP